MRSFATVGQRALAAALGLALAAFVVATPHSAVACTCGQLDAGGVVFTGVVTDSPNRSILLRAMYEGNAGIYTFDVEDVMRGDPMDGRVHTPFGFGGCGRVFELGATYRVHANTVDPDQEYLGRRPGAHLATGTCMDGEPLGPPNPLVAFRALAFTSEGLGLGIVGIGLLAGLGVYWWRRRRSDDFNTPRSD